MGEALPEIRAKGAELVAIGNGTPRMAEDFVSGFDVPFPVYTDPERAAYRLSGLRRNFGLGWKSIGRGSRAAKAGHRQGKVQGDAWQQGGVLIVSPEPRLIWRHVNTGAGDHADLGALLSALDSA